MNSLIVPNDAGKELAYAELATNQANASAADQAVAGLTLASFTVVEGQPVYVETFTPGIFNTLDAAISSLYIADNGTAIALGFVKSPAPALSSLPFPLRKKVSTPGAHVFVVRCFAYAGTPTVTAATFIRIVKA